MSQAPIQTQGMSQEHQQLTDSSLMCQSSFASFRGIQDSSEKKSDKNRMLANHASISVTSFITNPEVVADPN